MPNKRHIMIDAITRIIGRTSKKSEEQMDVEIDICTFTHLSKVLPPKEQLENLVCVIRKSRTAGERELL